MKIKLRVITVLFFSLVLRPDISTANVYEKLDADLTARVLIQLDIKDYDLAQRIRLTVVNGSDKDVCFESCNTIYLKKKKILGGWDDQFRKCEVSFIPECLAPGKTKIVQFIAADRVASVDAQGVYKVAVPIHGDCSGKMKDSEGIDVYDGCRYLGTVFSPQFRIR